MFEPRDAKLSSTNISKISPDANADLRGANGVIILSHANSNDLQHLANYCNDCWDDGSVFLVATIYEGTAMFVRTRAANMEKIVVKKDNVRRDL